MSQGRWQNYKMMLVVIMAKFLLYALYISVRVMLLLATYKYLLPVLYLWVSAVSYLDTNCGKHCKYRLGLVSVSSGSRSFQYSTWCGYRCTPKLNSQPKLVSQGCVRKNTDEETV